MFKWFKKWFKKKNDKKLETIFPTAQDTLKATSEKWPIKSDKEILQGINEAKDNGSRYKYFFKSYISKRTCQELRQQHYKIYITDDCDGAPCFKVSW